MDFNLILASNVGCKINYGNCEQLCLIGQNSQTRCACATGFTLNSDGRTCNQSRQFLVVATDSVIRGFDVVKNTHAEAMVPIASQGRLTNYADPWHYIVSSSCSKWHVGLLGYRCTVKS